MLWKNIFQLQQPWLTNPAKHYTTDHAGNIFCRPINHKQVTTTWEYNGWSMSNLVMLSLSSSSTATSGDLQGEASMDGGALSSLSSVSRTTDSTKSTDCVTKSALSIVELKEQILQNKQRQQVSPDLNVLQESFHERMKTSTLGDLSLQANMWMRAGADELSDSRVTWRISDVRDELSRCRRVTRSSIKNWSLQKGVRW